MKNLIWALSFVFAACSIGSTGCGGTTENKVIEAPPAGGAMPEADRQAYEAAQKKATEEAGTGSR